MLAGSMNKQVQRKQSGWRGSEELWLEAAYTLLVRAGVEAVKVMPLAQELGMSRTSFYWHFKNRDALLAALIKRWANKNTSNLIARTEQFAESITEAVFNLFDCWVDPDLFDAKFDFAIRNWAQNSPDLKQVMERADQSRIAAIRLMFLRFGYGDLQAETRALTLYYTQVGYISMMVKETNETRLNKMPAYAETYTGVAATPAEITRFRARHIPHGTAPPLEVQ